MQSHKASRQLSSSLAGQIETLTRDLDWTLAHFSFVVCVTVLKAECDIAHSPSMSVATSYGLDRPRLAFIGDSAELLATYATFLIDAGSGIELLVDTAQRDIASAAFNVRTSAPLWQMVFRGAAHALDSGRATALTGSDLPAMQALAESAGAKLRFVTQDIFAQGPTFGIWERQELIAMGTTNARVSGAAQIGNVIARSTSPQRLLRAEVAAALVKAHAAEGTTVFLIISQNDAAAVRLFEDVGFVRERPLYRIRCVLK